MVCVTPALVSILIRSAQWDIGPERERAGGRIYSFLFITAIAALALFMKDVKTSMFSASAKDTHTTTRF
jgi:hypothetical protein